MIKGKRAEVDWSSPETVVVIILCVLLGLVFLYYIWNLKGRLMP